MLSQRCELATIDVTGYDARMNASYATGPIVLASLTIGASDRAATGQGQVWSGPVRMSAPWPVLVLEAVKAGNLDKVGRFVRQVRFVQNYSKRQLACARCATLKKANPDE